MATTALVLPVPEAEPVVQAWRTKYDPVATRGMPAHVTLVYPFLPSPRLDAETLAAVGDVFGGVTAFRFALARCARFPGVLYLAPEPGHAIIDLIERIVARFPEAPPYGGQFAESVPHLTVAHASDASVLDGMESAIREALPIEVRTDRALLFVEEAGFWRPHTVFSIGEGRAGTVGA